MNHNHGKENLNTHLEVEAIKDGTVIDHIPAHIGIRLIRLLKLSTCDNRITIGFNLPSAQLTFKDIIKIENLFLTQIQANQLAIYAPNATVNQIKNFVVVDKFQLSLPKQVPELFRCPNSNCITRIEIEPTLFNVIANGDKVKLRCYYCEKIFDRDVMKENY